jgi:hypothetical protein
MEKEIKKFYYRDNWTGDIHHFKTLEEARESALSENGDSVAICGENGVIEFVKCRGYNYP